MMTEGKINKVTLLSERTFNAVKMMGKGGGTADTIGASLGVKIESVRIA